MLFLQDNDPTHNNEVAQWAGLHKVQMHDNDGVGKVLIRPGECFSSVSSSLIASGKNLLRRLVMVVVVVVLARTLHDLLPDRRRVKSL